ncbi:MAG: hypothetical protein ABJM61_06145 [Yoonia sp.]
MKGALYKAVIGVQAAYGCFVHIAEVFHLSGYLKQVMYEATREVIGCRVAVSWNYMGLDETEQQSPDYLEDYIAFRHKDRRHQSASRQRLFNERVAYPEASAG